MNDILADFLTEKKLAQELDLHERTLARWRARRIGPRFTQSGRQFLYHRDDVQNWLRAGGSGTAASAPTPQRRKRARAR